MKLRLPIDSGPEAEIEPVQPGDYFHSTRELFRVESREHDRVTLEDCRTGVLVDVELDRLRELERVQR